MATNPPLKTLNIGLAGLGNVGAGVFKNLDKNRALLRRGFLLVLNVAFV